MTTIWLNTGSQQLLSGFATVELLAHACLYLLCLHLFSHTGLNSFMVKEMSGPIFFFFKEQQRMVKGKDYSQCTRKRLNSGIPSSLLEPFPRSCCMAQLTSSLPMQDAHLELP